MMDYMVPYQVYNVSDILPKRLSCQQSAKVITDLNKANLYLKNQQYKKAIILLDKNIKTLGEYYLSSKMDLNDDTDVKLMLGNIEQQKGRWKQAAYLKRNVLESRVSIYLQIHPCALTQ